MANPLTDAMLDEIRRLEETGVTREEIVRQTGISATTIRKYLGYTSGHKNSRHSYAVESKKQEKAKPDARLSVQNKSIELHGRYGVYAVDCKKCNVIVSLAKSETEEDVFEVPFDRLDDLIGELMAIQYKVNRNDLDVSAEMW